MRGDKVLRILSILVTENPSLLLFLSNTEMCALHCRAQVRYSVRLQAARIPKSQGAAQTESVVEEGV
jgi:predicted transcriptional regulator